MLVDLWLPILLSSVALFFASFVSWMLTPLHFNDWVKLDKEDDFIDLVKNTQTPTGNYMFPGWNKIEEMKSEEYQKKYEEGPCGIITVFPKVSMGRNLGLTFIYFLVVSFLLGYLGTIGLEAGTDFMTVFRLISTAAFMTFLGSILQHSIWFRNRIIGHIVESIFYAAISGAIFAAFWPEAV